jgi:PTS system mannitol-specific IIC component
LKVDNSSVNSIPADADVVVCQEGLASRAKGNAPTVRIVAIKNFLEDPALDALYEELASRKDVVAVVAPLESEEDKSNSGVLALTSIKVGAVATDKWEAIAESGALLVKGGYVKMDYVDAMMERDKVATTYLGMGIAIPHGTQNAKREVIRTGISVVQYPDGVDFDGEKAYLVIGIAGVGDEHLELLAKVSEALDDEQVLERLKTTSNPEDIYEVLNA